MAAERTRTVRSDGKPRGEDLGQVPAAARPTLRPQRPPRAARAGLETTRAGRFISQAGKWRWVGRASAQDAPDGLGKAWTQNPGALAVNPAAVTQGTEVGQRHLPLQSSYVIVSRILKRVLHTSHPNP